MSFDLTFGLFYWLRIAGLAALLCFAMFMAWRRWTNAEPESEAKRIVFPWLTILLGFSIYAGLLSVFLAPVIIFYIVFFVGLWVAIPALVTVIVLDLFARLLRAARTRLWLVVGIAAFAASEFLWLALIGFGQVFIMPGLWLEVLAILSIPAAAAINWWSYLPYGGGGGERIAEAFE